MSIRDQSQKALHFRFSDDVGDSKFMQGIGMRPTKEATFDEVQDFVNNDETDKYEDLNVVSDPLVQYQTILETLKKFSSMAIQDDYQNYKLNDHHREVGKLLLIDQADYNTQHIFFDDNANE